MKQAFFDPVSGAIIEWRDTDAFSYPPTDPAQLLEVTEAQFEQEIYKSVVAGALSEADPVQPAPPPPTQDLRRQFFTNKVQELLDSTAAGMGFGDEKMPPMWSAVSYAMFGSVPEYQDQAIALGNWRSLVWQRCYELLAEVEAGTRPEPTLEDLYALLPAFGG